MERSPQDHRPIQKQNSQKFMNSFQFIDQTQYLSNLFAEGTLDFIKGTYKKNRKTKLEKMIKQFSKINYCQLSTELAEYLEGFFELSNQIKAIKSDIIKSQNLKHRILQPHSDYDSNKEIEIQKNRMSRLQQHSLIEMGTNELLGKNQKQIFLNLQNQIKKMETKVIKYLHKRQYFLILDKSICDICKSIFDTKTQLDGHILRYHPVRSGSHQLNPLNKENHGKRNRRYFKQNKHQFSHSRNISKKQQVLQKNKLKEAEELKKDRKVKIYHQIIISTQNKVQFSKTQILLDQNYDQKYQPNLRKKIKIQEQIIQPFEIYDQISPEQIPFYNPQNQDNIQFSTFRPSIHDPIEIAPDKIIQF